MHLSRLRPGEVLAGLAAVGLLITLVLKWAAPEPGLLRGPTGDLPASLSPLADEAAGAYSDRLAQSGLSALGWFTVLVLLVAAVLALLLVLATVTLEPVGLAVTATTVTTAFGAFATLVLLVRLTLAQPALGLSLQDADVALRWPAYVGLACTALIAVGGWLALADERTDAAYSAAPDLPPRPAPAA